MKKIVELTNNNTKKTITIHEIGYFKKEYIVKLTEVKLVVDEGFCRLIVFEMRLPTIKAATEIVKESLNLLNNAQ